ncbi:MAG: hypothetical protein KDA49_07060 [Rhodospirillaceae bacterium]|nr:hypothetical protein [Rhodospirillaceae bacterium]MCA8932212.1 hypothetical protein [Rhodospirillaceae bacterium]
MEDAAPGLSDAAREDVLKALETAVAVADLGSGEVLFENSKFFKWFPAPVEDDAAVWERLPGADWDTVLARLDRRGSASIDTESAGKPRTVPVVVALRRADLDGRACIVLEARDASRQREAEYMLDSYSKMAERQNRELNKEKEKAERLLLNIMPRLVYEELKDYGTTTPNRFDAASVLMVDFVGFTEMAATREPGTVISELNDIFTAFDRIVELFGSERIKTMGDGYMAVSGLPEGNPDHATNLVKVAIRMRRYLRRRNESHPIPWQCRIGVATGPVIGSVVGIQKYVYDVFGPAVNLAARLEAFADPMQIVICKVTRDALSEEFEVRSLGEEAIKGFGEIEIYSVDGEPSTRR